MQRYQDVVLNTRGEPVSGISVRVVTFPVTVDATIYSDDGITQTTNPLTTDANGRFSFYAADGRYSLQMSGGGITALTITDVLLQDAVAATIPESLFHNLSLQCSIAGNALTIALKTAAGSNPSTASPVRIVFRNSSAAIGDHTTVSVMSATSITLSNGSNLGQPFSSPFRLWIVAFNDAGVVRLGVINCTSGGGSNQGFAQYPLAAWGIASSTAEGGAGAADSALVFYTSAAVSSKAYTVLGYATYETVLAVAGAWSATPGRVQLFGPDVRLPGQIVQRQLSIINTVATGTTVIPADDTVPQITEGDSVQLLSIIPVSGANVAVVEAAAALSHSAVGAVVALAVFDTIAAPNAKNVVAFVNEAAGRIYTERLSYAQVIGGLTAFDLTIRVGGSLAGTTTLNGSAGARLYGGVYISWLDYREMMA